jgi:preprotein translocase subunit SecY
MTLTGSAYFLMMLGVFFLIVFGIVLITLAQRRVPLQVARHVKGARVYGGVRQYIPIKVNHANVMPIIFASALMIIPSTLLPALFGENKAVVVSWIGPGTFLYALVYVILIIFFCFFWNAISLNPKDLAENLKSSGQFIPGIRPGDRTQQYLHGVITRVTVAGAFFIAIIALIPMMIPEIFSLQNSMALMLFQGSGLLIVVGVVLDMVQKVEAQLAQRHYQGFFGGS